MPVSPANEQARVREKVPRGGKAGALWNIFTTGSMNRRIFGATIIITLWSAVVKIAAVANSLVVAWRFGIGDELDAFYLALLIHYVGINVIANSFSMALIPTFVRVQEQKGAEVAQRLFSQIMSCSLGLLGAATLVTVMGAPFYLPWVASGFSPGKLDLTYYLICATAPLLLFSGLSNVWGATLNAVESFALSAFSPIATPALSILCLLIFKSWGVFALAAGVVCGALVEMIILGVGLRRRGISLRPQWHGFDPHLREVFMQFSPRVGSSLLRSGANVVNQSMAAMLPPGSVAALNYGNRIASSILNLTAVALGSAITPFFSKMAARRDWKGIRHTLRRYLLLVFLVTVPVTLLILIFPRAITRGLFQRGSFTADDTEVVSQVLAFYVLQIPFVVANVLTSRLIWSLLKTHLTMWAAAINVSLNIVLNFFFIRKFGAAGISLSISCASMASFFFMLYQHFRLLKEAEG